MDILATGKSGTNKLQITKIAEYVKTVEKNFHDKVQRQGIKYVNLFEYLQAHCKEGKISGVEEITESEMRDALIQLEGEEVLTLVGHRLTPTIRFRYD